MRTVRLKFFAFSLLLLTGLLLLGGCGSTSTTPQTDAGTTALNTVLPNDIPLYQRAMMQQSYQTMMSGHAAMTWAYVITTPGVTPQMVMSFYRQQMANRGWIMASMPMETMRGPYGQDALAYQQGQRLVTIACGFSLGHPQQVELLISVMG